VRILRSVTLLAALALPASFAHGQIAVGIGIGPVIDYPAPVYVAAPPVCPWGYYPYWPYECAPYGYYGPDWFVSGVFIGAGPWFTGWFGAPWGWGWGHPWGGWGWGHPYWGYGRGYGWGYTSGYSHGYVNIPGAAGAGDIRTGATVAVMDGVIPAATRMDM